MHNLLIEVKAVIVGLKVVITLKLYHLQQLSTNLQFLKQLCFHNGKIEI